MDNFERSGTGRGFIPGGGLGFGIDERYGHLGMQTMVTNSQYWMAPENWKKEPEQQTKGAQVITDPGYLVWHQLKRRKQGPLDMNDAYGTIDLQDMRELPEQGKWIWFGVNQVVGEQMQPAATTVFGTANMRNVGMFTIDDYDEMFAVILPKKTADELLRHLCGPQNDPKIPSAGSFHVALLFPFDPTWQTLRLEKHGVSQPLRIQPQQVFHAGRCQLIGGSGMVVTMILETPKPDPMYPGSPQVQDYACEITGPREFHGMPGMKPEPPGPAGGGAAQATFRASFQAWSQQAVANGHAHVRNHLVAW